MVYEKEFYGFFIELRQGLVSVVEDGSKEEISHVTEISD